MRRLFLAFCWCSLLLLSTTVRAESPRLEVNAGHSSRIEHLVISEDGTMAYSAEGPTLFIWKISSRLLFQKVTLEAPILDLRLLESHQLLLVGTQSGFLGISLVDYSVRYQRPLGEVTSFIHEPLLDAVYALEGKSLLQIDPVSGDYQYLQRSLNLTPFADGSASIFGFPEGSRLIPLNDQYTLVTSAEGVSRYDHYGMSFTEHFRPLFPSAETPPTVVSLNADYLLVGAFEAFVDPTPAHLGRYRLHVVRKSDSAVMASATIVEKIAQPRQRFIRLFEHHWNLPDQPIIVFDEANPIILRWDGASQLEVVRAAPMQPREGVTDNVVSALVPFSQDNDRFLLATLSRYEEDGIHLVIPQLREIHVSPDGHLLNVATLGTSSLTPNHLAVHPTRNQFAISDDSGATKLVSWENGKLRVVSAPVRMRSPHFSDNGTRLLWKDSARWKSVSSLTSTPIWTRIETAPARDGFSAMSPNGRYVASNQFGALHVIDMETGQVVLALPRPEDRMNWLGLTGAAAFSPSNELLIYNTKALRTPAAGGSPIWRDVTRAIRLSDGQQLWETSAGQPWSLAFMGEATVAQVVRGPDRLVKLDTDTGEVIRSEPLPGEDSYADEFRYTERHCSVLSASGEYGAFAREDVVTLFSLRAPDALVSLPRFGAKVLSLAYLHGDRHLLIGTADQKLRMWDLVEKRELATMAFFRTDDDWVLSTPDFRFDASAGAEDRMFIAQGDETIPLSTHYAQWHTPRLLDQVLEHAISAPSFLPQRFTIPPILAMDTTVSDDGTEISLTLDAKSDAAAIEEIRLYHNGKLVSAKQRGLRVEDDEPPPANTSTETYQLSRAFQLSLLEGENTFRAIALDAERVESLPIKEVVPGPTFESTRGFRIHLLAVGIDQYANPRHALNYARADASAFVEQLSAHSKGLFTDSQVTLLLDGAATRAGILKAFEKIVSEAQPRDVVIFYYAGHGVVSGLNSPEFYLIPADVTQLYGDERLLREKAISADELREITARIPAQKQIFLLDACQSAGALETIARRGAAQERAIAQLARSTGTYWLTATGTEQVATEFESLGHGAFTYSILEAMRDSRGDANGDGQLTVRELDAYLQARVPELTEEQRGARQVPASFGYGQDFPFALTAKENP